MQILRGKNLQTKCLCKLEQQLNEFMNNNLQDLWAWTYEHLDDNGQIERYSALLVWWGEEELE